MGQIRLPSFLSANGGTKDGTLSVKEPKKTSFWKKVDKHQTVLGYFPITGIFAGGRRLYKAHKAHNISMGKLGRGFVEISGLGFLILFPMDQARKSHKGSGNSVSPFEGGYGASPFEGES